MNHFTSGEYGIDNMYVALLTPTVVMGAERLIHWKIAPAVAAPHQVVASPQADVS
jgi:hypothetical protein